jgi:2-oxoglutarate dehydrogenase E1 component
MTPDNPASPPTPASGAQEPPQRHLDAPSATSVNGWNAEYIDALYQQWIDKPDSLESQWQRFFEGFDLGYRPSIAVDQPAPALPPPVRGSLALTSGQAPSKQSRVDALIYHYRDIGHLAADLDPLGTRRPFPEDLTLQSFGLSETDLDQSFDPGRLPLPDPAPLRDILKYLEETYSRHIGVEYMHIQDRAKVLWLQDRMEPIRNAPAINAEAKLRILRDLIEASVFENFLHTRYQGKKRFSLEGGESLIPMLNEIANTGPGYGIKEYVFSMAHRGRLNVLVNTLQKTYDQIFTEFEEAWVEDYLEGGGDVKYHRGFSSDLQTSSGERIHLSLGGNPSHLEFGHSVQLGRARAKQRLRSDTDRRQVVPILIHGDAAFPGQGVVAECFNMMNLDGYTVGGAIHIVVNNQVGFTTNPSDTFGGKYCTDIAKMAEAPIFHVNGDDPEACVFVAQLALAYRQTFKCDVVLDMWCYRRYGHNEGDDPTYTQPLLYSRVHNHWPPNEPTAPVLRDYASRLANEGIISPQEFHKLSDDLRIELDQAQTRSKERPVDPIIDPFRLQWVGLTEKYTPAPSDTTASLDSLLKVSKALGTVPTNFSASKKLQKLLEYRRTAVEADQPLDWAMGELLAYGTLLAEGHAVRLTGQDVERGTFSHRHAVLFDQSTGEGFTALNAIDEGQARFCIHNSPLTESACVGFEYGYSLADPRMLILWEAQFGDFANGAQVIFDQFVASAETKWQRHSGLVCLLPHGYEGQGPEHSSARLERFLQLCADNNMQVCYPTTPAQIFHVLRRQMKRNFRKPLIIMSPKSLLRHPLAVSQPKELTNDGFHRVLDDPKVKDHGRVNRVLMCSGKIYYDLVAHREQAKRDDVAIIRIEQLYPFPESVIADVLNRYERADEIVWVQEEPKNMGAYRHVQAMMRDRLELDLPYVGREMKPSPAVASEKMHKQEQEKILIAAIGLSSTGDLQKKGGKPRPRLKSHEQPTVGHRAS